VLVLVVLVVAIQEEEMLEVIQDFLVMVVDLHLQISGQMVAVAAVVVE
jgi:hypothetical protein